MRRPIPFRRKTDRQTTTAGSAQADQAGKAPGNDQIDRQRQFQLAPAAQLQGLDPATVLEHMEQGASRPEELHPRPLTERCVNLSSHTAPIKQTHRPCLSANARRDTASSRKAVRETCSPVSCGPVARLWGAPLWRLTCCGRKPSRTSLFFQFFTRQAFARETGAPVMLFVSA